MQKIDFKNLYEIAKSKINPRKISPFIEAGEVAAAILTENGNVYNITIEKLSSSEMKNILPLLKFLAEHHNKVSANFSGIGMYPYKSFEDTISEIAQNVENGKSIVDVIKKENQIIGFSQYVIEDNIGELKHLIVLPEYRNQGYGKLLIERALNYFENQKVKRIDLRVVYGNDSAKRFYERYGFKTATQIMIKK